MKSDTSIYITKFRLGNVYGFKAIHVEPNFTAYTVRATLAAMTSEVARRARGPAVKTSEDADFYNFLTKSLETEMGRYTFSSDEARYIRPTVNFKASPEALEVAVEEMTQEYPFGEMAGNRHAIVLENTNLLIKHWQQLWARVAPAMKAAEALKNTVGFKVIKIEKGIFEDTPFYLTVEDFCEETPSNWEYRVRLAYTHALRMCLEGKFNVSMYYPPDSAKGFRTNREVMFLSNAMAHSLSTMVFSIHYELSYPAKDKKSAEEARDVYRAAAGVSFKLLRNRISEIVARQWSNEDLDIRPHPNVVIAPSML